MNESRKILRKKKQKSLIVFLSHLCVFLCGGKKNTVHVLLICFRLSPRRRWLSFDNDVSGQVVTNISRRHVPN